MSKRRIPNGLYFTVEDWANSFSDVRNRYIKMDLQDISIFSTPKTLTNNIHWKFRQEYKQSPPSTFIISLPEGRVVGENGVVITKENKLLWEVSIEYGKNAYQHSIFNQTSLSPGTYLDKSIGVLAFCASEYYYHWMFDVLPRIGLLRQNNINVDQLIINRKGGFKFQADTLNKLGIKEEQLIECTKQTHIQARELIVPSSPGYTGHMPKWACNFLRGTFLDSNPTNKGTERIYISRQNTNSRKLVNENEVIELLKKYGFKCVILEKMSIEEQITLFSTAEIIVAPHGGGLANLVFCNSGTKVIEFFSPKYVNVLYWVLSNHVSLDYYYLIGTGEHPPEYVDPHIVWDNITVDLNELKEILKLASIE